MSGGSGRVFGKRLASCQGKPISESQRRLEGVCQPLLEPRLHDESIDDDFDRVFLLVESGSVGEINHETVHTCPDEA